MLALTTSVPLSRKRRRVRDRTACLYYKYNVNQPSKAYTDFDRSSAERILRPSTNEAKIRIIVEHLPHAPLRKAFTQANQLGPRAAGRGRGRAETQAQACEKQ